MKILKYISIIFLSGVMAMGLNSCSSWVEGYSIDPNNPSDVPENLLLPSGMLAIGSILGEDQSWYSQVFMQTHVGIARQMNAATRYNLTAADVSNGFNSPYWNVLTDLKIIEAKADQNGNNYYKGISLILQAVTLGSVTDAWGDVPWNDANKGVDVLQPAFDNSRDVIYPAILSLLDGGIAALKDGNNVALPGGDDLVFSGDNTAWIAAAHALKARYLNHYSNDNPTTANTALDEIADAMADNSGNAYIPYGTADPNEANPWYQFNTQRGDLVLGKFFVDMLVANDDPRLPFYATPDTSGDYSGSELDPPSDVVSTLGTHYGSVSSALPVITFAEVKFIEAEVNMRKGDKGPALAAYTAAVNASVEEITGAAAPQDFLDAVIPANSDDLTMKMIMDQKYLAMFTQFESWVDYRRTGFPELSPYPGQSSVPGRFPYGQRERNLNPNVPTGNEYSLFGKLWWAQ